ncbi:hypothetical protein AB4Y85_10330 [Microvirga sp. 2YAF29]|uniref:hypothetical protein n=1 Tax=Microvirga sp. 2YAF29 TaxID=3233031 RepID=UPI003F9C914C
MEHKPVEALRGVAEVHEFSQGFLSRRERLERWAEVLERQPKRRLRSLGEIEFTPEDKRPELRSDESPITVAFEDPVLRAAGLRSDKLGDAVEFFDLSDRAAHRLLCSCMNGWSMEAGTTARKVHRLANPDHRLMLFTAAGVLAAAPTVFYLLT